MEQSGAFLFHLEAVLGKGESFRGWSGDLGQAPHGGPLGGSAHPPESGDPPLPGSRKVVGFSDWRVWVTGNPVG